jgi:hypothetical protein
MYKHYQYGYYVSNKGKIKRLRNGKKCDVKIFIGKCGYKFFYMFHNKENVFVHKAVAKLFIPKIKGKWIIDHINRNKLDNEVKNLRWVTHKENMNNRSDNIGNVVSP